MSNDSTLVLLVLAGGLLPLSVTLVRERRGTPRTFGLALLTVPIVVFLVAAAARESTSNDVSPPSISPRTVREDGYVGSDACSACHPYQHATWHASYHRTMTQLAGPQSILAPFDGTELELEGVSWRLERRADGYWATARAAGSDGADADSLVEKRVALTTGSHNYQMYWFEPGGPWGMQRLPLVYLLDEQLWVPRKSRFIKPPTERTSNETGRWKAHCIKCHATRGRKEAPPGGDTRVAELGISCEACHGPGAEHVARNRDPLRRFGQYLRDDPDPTIVNPRRLPHDRSTEVCGQCHSIEIFLTQEKARDWQREGSRYRPGDELSRFQTTVVGRYDDNPPEVQRYIDDHPTFQLGNCFWPDGMLRVTGREYHGMLETPCYQRGEMSCLSCHRMHRPADDARPLSSWANDQLGPRMDGDEACLRCHPSFEDRTKLVAHTHHEVGSTGSACYNCHMPYTTWGLLRAIRSHTVDSPDVARTVATGRPNACNQCHLDRTLLWTAEKLREWYDLEPPALSEDDRTIAASLLLALRGDAVQRALMAWSMGWEPARQASGSDWMVPYLAWLMQDPYDAVRFSAQRSLRGYAEYADATTDSVMVSTKYEQALIMKGVLEDWVGGLPDASGKRGPHLLTLPDGTVDHERFMRLIAQRDDRDLTLFE